MPGIEARQLAPKLVESYRWLHAKYEKTRIMSRLRRSDGGKESTGNQTIVTVSQHSTA